MLEQAATALALSRLADGEGAWARLRAEGLIAALLGERYVTVADIEARLEAAGFPVRGRMLHVAVETADAPARSLSEDAQRPRRNDVPDESGATAFRLASLAQRPRESEPDIRILEADIGPERILLLSLPSGSRPPESLVEGLGSGAVSDPASSVAELLATLPVVRRLARQAEPGEVLRVADRPLARLAAELSGDHRLQEHSARLLAPLIRHDDATGGDLLTVLRAVVTHPGSRTAAASASHLSRSVFYQRLTLIADLLGADLDDGETLSALHLALLARGR